MTLPKYLLTMLAGCLGTVLSIVTFAQAPLRLAVLDLKGDETGEMTVLVRRLVKEQPAEFEILDPALIRAAAQGAGYSGSLNLQREEARALGFSLGCDFYLLGKSQSGRRLGEGPRQYYEALVGLFAVETRTGHLVSFIFLREEGATELLARQQLQAAIKHAWPVQVRKIQAAQQKHQDEIAQTERRTPAVSPLIEVLMDEQLGQSDQQPIFYQRLKPEYTKEAEWAGITATVELEAVFQADGKVGEVLISRWAGFGLDEAAVETVRKLRFKPAIQTGKEVTIRGLVRYNFRRPPSLAERQAEAERLKRSLRDLNSPKILVPLHPD